MVQTLAAAAPVRIVRQRRIAESPARWRAALERALENALDVYVEPVSGEAFVESASRPGTLYAVTRTTCTCQAGLADDPVCQHRAVYRCQMGELPLPEAAAPAPKPHPRCRWCFGNGERWIAGELAECPQCGGNGMRPRHPELNTAAAA